MSAPQQRLYIIIGGGGQVGYFLAKELDDLGHEVTLIERDARRFSELERTLGDRVFHGDACEVSTLESAGCERADYLLAVTGDDEDNLVMCQMAKVLQTKHTIARVNNVACIDFFKDLGIDTVVSPTQNILDVIQGELPLRKAVHLVTAEKSSDRLIELFVPDGSRLVGVPSGELGLDDQATIVLIVRDKSSFKPKAGTLIKAGDKLFAVVNDQGEVELERLVWED